MNEIKIEKDLAKRKISRDIVKEIISFGVSESQKLDIIYFLAIELEDNKLMKNITSLLKNDRITFNDEKEDNKIINKPDKIIID